jgi:hypothetical protein
MRFRSAGQTAHSRGMTFFDSFPKPASPEPPHRSPRQPWQQPETLIPGSAPIEALLVRTESVAVAVGSFRAYPNGFQFALLVRQRRASDSVMPGAIDPFGWHSHRSGGETDPGRMLRVGIEFADGQRVATSGRRGLPREPSALGKLLLQEDNSNSSEQRWEGNFWVHPLPPDGPVTFVVSWLAEDVTEERTQVDGTAIRAAAGRAVTLWPDDPDTWGGGGMTSASAVSSSSATATATPPGRPRPPENGAANKNP